MQALISDPVTITPNTPRQRQSDAEQQDVSAGDKLLCVDDRNIHRTYYPGPPVRGGLYCVREVYQEAGITGVLLAGIIGPRNAAGLECGFLLTRFRRLHD